MQAITPRIRDSYQWRTGSRFTIDPGIVGARLEELASQNDNQLTTSIVADEATNPNSPLYDLFEHDLEIAINEYHKAQARSIVNNLVIVTIIPTSKEEKQFNTSMPVVIDVDMESEENEDEGNIPIVARAFPSVLVNGQRCYTPLQIVLNDGQLRDQYMETIHEELKSLVRKAKDFKIFSQVVRAIEELPDTIN